MIGRSSKENFSFLLPSVESLKDKPWKNILNSCIYEGEKKFGSETLDRAMGLMQRWVRSILYVLLWFNGIFLASLEFVNLILGKCLRYKICNFQYLYQMHKMYLKVSKGIWRCIKVSEGIWRYLTVFECIWRHLKVSEGICRCQNVSEVIWRHFDVFEGIWMYLIYLEGTTCWMHQSFSAIGIRLFGMMPPTMINGSIGCLVLWTESIQAFKYVIKIK